MDFQHFDDIEDSTRDLQWRRSSRCGTGACVDVARDGDKILVRDGKFGAVSNTLVYSVSEWLEILEAVRHGVQTLDLAVVDGGVWFGGVEDGLFFNTEEWRAFETGVLLWEFEPDRLSTSAPASEGEQVADEVGPVTSGSDLAATGADKEESVSGGTVPVAANPTIGEALCADGIHEADAPCCSVDASRRADDDAAYCGFCDHHADAHTYGTGDPLRVPCTECPGGTCRRGAAQDPAPVAATYGDFKKVTYPDGSALYIHGCGHVEWWSEVAAGPISAQGCDACESAPDGSWRPLYVREDISADELLRRAAAPLVPVDENTGACSEVAA